MSPFPLLLQCCRCPNAHHSLNSIKFDRILLIRRDPRDRAAVWKPVESVHGWGQSKMRSRQWHERLIEFETWGIFNQSFFCAPHACRRDWVSLLNLTFAIILSVFSWDFFNRFLSKSVSCSSRDRDTLNTNLNRIFSSSSSRWFDNFQEEKKEKKVR